MCQGWSIRVLFSTTPGLGHLHPLVPLATAFADDGHDVVFAAAAAMREHVAALGFRMLAAGLDPADLDPRFRPFRESIARLPIAERRAPTFASRFAILEAPGKLSELRDVARRFEPDLLVYESCDLAAPIVATALGIPSVRHGFGRHVTIDCYERGAPEVEHLWRMAGLEPAPLCGVAGTLYLDICPPSFQTDALPDGTPSELLRPEATVRVGETEPDWLDGLPPRPTIYVTLGTAFNDLRHFRLILDALASLDCNVVATIGQANDPGALEPTPANARVQRYVSQTFVMPHADVVVSHGGSGTTLATFAAGLPSLLLPQGADQFENAARCSELGAGLVLLPNELTAAAVRVAVEKLLEQLAYRVVAQRLAAEIAAMPPPSEVARRLAASYSVAQSATAAAADEARSSTSA